HTSAEPTLRRAPQQTYTRPSERHYITKVWTQRKASQILPWRAIALQTFAPTLIKLT
ncbi:hypothetical protein M9458_029462, partial [Cirrhinus mrigala]